MSLVERYIFGSAWTAFLGGLGALTGVIWVTQALQQFDLLTTKGQSLLMFFFVTGLTLPSLVMVIAPVALLGGVIYALNKLNADSELSVMSAAGVSPARLIRPFVVLIVLVTMIVSAISLWAMPTSFRTIRDLISKVRADFLSRVVREGTFTTLEQGFVFHYRERAGNGALLGIFMQDRRDPAQISTYIAEAGVTYESGANNYLLLEKGSIQRQASGDRDPAIITFENYAIDLAQFGSANGEIPLKPREMTTAQLLNYDFSQPANAIYRAEFTDRLINPLYTIMFGLIAFAALFEPRTTRQGRGAAIGAAIAIALALRMAGFGAAALLMRTPLALILVYGLPLMGSVGSVVYVFVPVRHCWLKLRRSFAPAATQMAL
jgi:lipopolysaccharide export system permease protein